MGDKNDRLGRVLLDFSKEVVALALERLIADGKHLVKHQNVALGLDGHGEGKTNLHTGGIVFELLVHEVLKLGELHDVIIHRVNLRTSESKQSAVQVHILTAGQFRVEANAEFDEWHQLALDGDRALLRGIDLGDDLQQCGLAGTVTANNTEKVALAYFEIDVAEHMLLGVAFDALRPV